MLGLHLFDLYPNNFPVVLLLHGLGANGSSWSLQFDSLKNAGYRPIAPDMPGFGDSKYDGHGWDFRRLANNLVDVVNELRCGPVNVVGLSMGGVIAQQFVLDHPDLVQKLVLVSTFSELRPASFSQAYYFFQRILAVHVIGLKAQSKIVSGRIFPLDGQEELRALAEKQIISADPRAYRSAMRNLALFSSRKRLKEINKPTLVISGANDTTVGIDQQKILADGIPGARHVVIPNAGHAVAIDQFEKFNKTLLDFLLDNMLRSF